MNCGDGKHYFNRLKSFTEEADRNLGNCNKRYAAERMEMCVVFVSQLKQHIQDHIAISIKATYSGSHSVCITAKLGSL